MTVKLSNKAMRLNDPDFYARDSREVAIDLLGATIEFKPSQGEHYTATIVETEAYRQFDPACHAWGLRDGVIKNPKARAAFLFEKPGLAYIYLCYGMHELFNVVTEPEGTAGAVLVRAVQPIHGIDLMHKRRRIARNASAKNKLNLTNGPGKWTQAFGIDRSWHGIDLTSAKSPIKIYSAPEQSGAKLSSPRVGIHQGQDLMWRYFLQDTPYLSRAKENTRAESISLT